MKLLVDFWRFPRIYDDLHNLITKLFLFWFSYQCRTILWSQQTRTGKNGGKPINQQTMPCQMMAQVSKKYIGLMEIELYHLTFVNFTGQYLPKTNCHCDMKSSVPSIYKDVLGFNLQFISFSRKCRKCTCLFTTMLHVGFTSIFWIVRMLGLNSVFGTIHLLCKHILRYFGPPLSLKSRNRGLKVNKKCIYWPPTQILCTLATFENMNFTIWAAREVFYFWGWFFTFSWVLAYFEPKKYIYSSQY